MATLDAADEDLTVACVETIDRAAEWLDAHPRVDAVVGELELPERSLIELLELIRSRDPDLPIVLVGSDPSSALERAAIAAGATDIVRDEDESAVSSVLRARLERSIGRYWARRERRAQRRSLQALVVALPEATLVVDESGTIDFANPAVEDVLGYTPAELVGESLTMVMPEQEIQRRLDAVERRLAADERPVVRESIEIVGRHRAGYELQLELAIGGFIRDEQQFLVAVVRDVTARDIDRRKRENELETLSSRLDQLDRIVETLLRIGRVLVRADTRTELERGVCRELAGSGEVAFAWIGEPGEGDGEFQQRARAGHDRGYLDAVTGRPDEDPEPAVETFRTRTPTVIDDIDADPERDSWREAARERGIRSAVSVPLLEGDLLHGALTVYASEAEAFDDLDERVLRGIADTVAYGIGALQRGRALIADTVVELELQLVGGDDIFSRLARVTGATVELDGVVPHADSFLLFLAVTNASIDRVAATLEADPSVGEVSYVEEETGVRFEVTVETEPLFTQLIRAGVRMEAVTARPDDIRMQVSLPVDANVRGVIESLAAEYDEITLLSRTDRPREFVDERSFLSRLERRLTDRQLESLRTAFLSGYFEWPREHTSEEVAALLNISQPTFNHHLRIAERKLLSLIFGSEEA